MTVMKKALESMRRPPKRWGPVGLSLVAAALTATAFAAVSVAQDDTSSQNSAEKRGGDVVMRAPEPGGPHMFTERLSEEDRAALEEFRRCMEDNGAPAPPELAPAPSKPGSFEHGDGPPEPPGEEDRAAIEKALETCEDKLPGGAAFEHGATGGPGCGPPPGLEAHRGPAS